jgi:uncharacterized membrane protein
MEASVEARLHDLEDRVMSLEARLRPAPPYAPPPQRPVTVPSAPERAARSWTAEELLGGRVLAWLGGIAVVLGVVFFLALAVDRGWIDEPTRVVLAFAGSTALLGVGLWLYERKGRTQAALAAVAAAIAALYASDTAATVLYHLVSTPVGLAVAGLVGVVATAIAVRWDSPVAAGIGIGGALLAPVLVGAGRGTAGLAFMAVALTAAVGVTLWRRWSWLSAVAFVASAPQLAAWLVDVRHEHLVEALVVLAGFWALYVVAAIGYELRVPTAKLRVVSAALLLANAAAIGFGGWALLHGADHSDAATAWVLAVGAAYVALGAAVLRSRTSREIPALLVTEGAALAAIGLALALDGLRSWPAGRPRRCSSRGRRAGPRIGAATSGRPWRSPWRRGTRCCSRRRRRRSSTGSTRSVRPPSRSRWSPRPRSAAVPPPAGSSTRGAASPRRSSASRSSTSAPWRSWTGRARRRRASCSCRRSGASRGSRLSWSASCATGGACGSAGWRCSA